MSESPAVVPRTTPSLRVLVREADAEEICWRLEAAGATAIETRDAGTITPERPGHVLLLAGFCDSRARGKALRAVGPVAGLAAIEPIEVADDGWSSGWRAFHKPVILRRIEVITPWMEPGGAGRIPIVVDPGRAFGTGGHATTRLLLELLEEHATAPGLPAAILDVGTGSGVLAIAALKLGAERALGIDCDAEAIAVAEENAARNGVEARLELRRGTPEDVVAAFPLVLANIDLATFERAAPAIGRLVSRGAEALLSGLLDDQVGRCCELWPGFRTVEVREREGWAALALRCER
jgi:ribosomal protein L11 methyltransferase